MTGSLIQKSDELLIDCVDLGTMLLDFLECLVLFRHLILLSRKDGKRTLKALLAYDNKTPGQ